jgi:hypothetical protein
MTQSLTLAATACPLKSYRSSDAFHVARRWAERSPIKADTDRGK